MTELTKAELSNGWDAASLDAYRRDRDQVADVTPGNVVTEFKRPRPMLKIEGAGRHYSPFTRSHQ